MVQDEEVTRLTGTHATFTREQIEKYADSRAALTDASYWAVLVRTSGDFLGEAVLNEVDFDNESAGFRIALFGSLGQGFGTEATRLVVDYALRTVGLHRVSLEVFDFNPRAQRAYEKAGFVREGILRDSLLWDGERHDTIVMSVLRSDLD
jgi:RimJ/RimL family protein N-acetyltransferase